MIKFLLILVILTSALFGIAQTRHILVKNDASRAAKKGYYNWRIYLVGRPDTLKKIKEVIYTLHSTFKNPVQKRTYAQSRIFEYKASGWGEFDIKVKIVFTDKKRYPMYLIHHLDLRVR